MLIFISIIFPDVTQQLIEDAKNRRNISKSDDNNELMEIDPEIYQEIKNR